MYVSIRPLLLTFIFCCIQNVCVNYGNSFHHRSFLNMSEKQLQYEMCKKHVGQMDLSSAWMFRGENQTTRQQQMDLFRWCLNNRKMLLDSRDRFGEAQYKGLHHEIGGIDYPTVTVRGLMGTNFMVPAYDYVVSNRIKTTGTYEVSELEVMERYIEKGTMVLDIGANTGAYTPYMALFTGPKGIVFAYEPFKMTYQVLTANVAFNGLQNVWTWNMGLGAYPSRQLVQGPSFNDFTNAGMMRVFDQLPQHQTRSNSLVYDGTESVVVNSLDRHLNETLHLLAGRGQQDIKISFVKIDVEDHCEMVLLGARKMLREHRPILLIEWEVKPRVLDELGYDCRTDSWIMDIHGLLLCTPWIQPRYSTVIERLNTPDPPNPQS